jgi:serine/threonine-protein kinase
VVVDLLDESEATVRNAKGLVPLRHTKLVSVREVVVEGGLVAVESDYVEGEWLSDLFEGAWRSKPPPLRALLRILSDVLEGVTALHRARGPFHAPLKLVHGELAPANILVGTDGVARLANLLREDGAEPSAEVIGYVAPEVLLHDQSADERADVFSAGVVLWEALSGRRLHSATRAGEIVVRLLGGKVQKAEVSPELSWAEPLTEVARRALLPEIGSRYSTAAELATALKNAVAENLGAKGDVAALVQALAGPRIRARAQAGWLEQAASPVAAIAVASGPPSFAGPDSAPLSAGVRADIPTLRPPGSLPPSALERTSSSAPMARDAVDDVEAFAMDDPSNRVTAVPRISAPPVPSKPPAPPVPSKPPAPPVLSKAPPGAPPSKAPPAPVLSKPPAPPLAPSAPAPPPASAGRISVPTPIVPIADISAFTKAMLARAQPAEIDDLEPDDDVLPPVLRSEPVPPPAPIVTPPVPTPPAVVLAPAIEEAPVPEGTEVSLPPVAAADRLTPKPRRRRRGAVLVALLVALPIAVIGWFALGSSRTGGPEHAASAEPPKREVGLAARPPENPPVIPPPAPSPPPTPTEPASSEPTPAVADESPSVDAGERARASSPTTPAPSASGTEVVAPPPLRKKSKASYYPLGI